MEGEDHLILPCEIAVKSVIPAIKAALAKELVETHNLTQDRAAEILGVSQSAVSKYTRRIRGYVIEVNAIEGVQPLIRKMTTQLVDGNSRRADLLDLFCQTCREIRRKGLTCKFCHRADSKIKAEECDFCFQ